MKKFNKKIKEHVKMGVLILIIIFIFFFLIKFFIEINMSFGLGNLEKRILSFNDSIERDSSNSSLENLNYSHLNANITKNSVKDNGGALGDTLSDSVPGYLSSNKSNDEVSSKQETLSDSVYGDSHFNNIDSNVGYIQDSIITD